MEKIKEKIKEDISLALKEGNKKTSSVLRMVLSSILLKEKDKNYKLRKESPGAKDVDISDKEALDVISSEVKKRKDSVFEFEKGERKDLADKEKEEIEVLLKYLPEQMSEEEVKEIVLKAAKEKKTLGEIMSEVMPKVKGRADGTLVNKMVKDILNAA